MKTEKSVLVTGFAPFGGQRINPSWVCVDMLPDSLMGVKIIKRELPVVWYEAINMLYELIDEYSPRGIICVGQAGGYPDIIVERVGINLCNGADNDGVTLKDAPIFPGAPSAYFSTLPYDDILADLQGAKIPSRFSFSAGTYLCNHVLYGVLHRAAVKKPGMRGGFVHVPFLPQQVIDTGGKSMPLEVMSKGVELCVEGLCKVI